MMNSIRKRLSDISVLRVICACLFAAAAIMIYSPACHAEENGKVFIEDNWDLYTDDTYYYILSELQKAADETGWNFGIYTTEEFDYDPERYGENTAYTMAGRKAEEIYDNTFGRDSSGMLFFCDIGYRYVVVAGDAENYISGKRLNNMLSSMKDEFFDHDDRGCAMVFIHSTLDYYRKGPGSTDITTMTVVIPLLVGLLIAAIACAAAVHSYKSIPKPDTQPYLDPGSLDIYHRENNLVHTSSYTYTRESSSGGGTHSGGFSGGHHGGGGFGGHR
ncbi:MAG: TPM domain-containing protein [Oscillospiraceae bacterium]|nr:TPM domain-containing protein [Oscillospiraceae bacterium]